MFVYDEKTNTIETEALLLRQFVLEDSQSVAIICNSDQVQKGTLSLPKPYTVASAIAWITTHKSRCEQDSAYNYAITDKKTGQLYGSVSLVRYPKTDLAELGYWIDPEVWNKGIATEAAKAMINYGFQIKNLHKITAKHFLYNMASGKVMAKAGMSKEGYQKQQVLKDGNYEDVVHYGVLNSEVL
ncbi:N-acetyltransferase [Streptococcus iniae]|uniref:GNAT family N-acetyltransferase n=1 Tax=Streptococcus iniae TaxID=1346 RepID=UPI0008D9CB7B|nr:GNAT family protein [Streptococcus iniae]OHX26249.1 GNAT family N-acetyltransferase [Streptococcus iniae]RLV28431.1 N-acetyltransferase [Streptococcus iniae]